MKNPLPRPIAAALLLTALAGCNGPSATTAEQAPTTPEAQLQVVQDSLMQQHERLMGRDEQLIALAARLNATPQPPRALLARISAADNAMMSWMHQSHDTAPDSTAPVAQRLAYFQNQQRQLAAIAQQLGSAYDSAAAAAKTLPADSTGMATPAMQMPMPKK